MSESPQTEDLATLADLIVTVARSIQFTPFGDESLIRLTPLEALIMQHIDRNPGIQSKQIAIDLRLKSSNTSTALRELEQKKLITRQSDLTDRRMINIWPTDLAHTNLKHLHTYWANMLEPANIKPADLKRTIQSLTKIKNALNEITDI